jgi:hypothetical protein
MLQRLPLIACAAYLVAAFPAHAQNKTSHDSCGGDSCASDAYDLGYHDGYEDRSYTSILALQNNPQYEAGFSEGEMDAMAEKDALTGGEQGSEGQPKAAKGYTTRAGPSFHRDGWDGRADRSGRSVGCEANGARTVAAAPNRPDVGRHSHRMS